MGATWIDLLDPSPEARRAQAPHDHEAALAGSGSSGGSAGSGIG